MLWQCQEVLRLSNNLTESEPDFDGGSNYDDNEEKWHHA